MATKFDAVLGSELRDTQSEILDIKGADISELLAGRGVVNDNHSNKLPDVLGRITSAKKIFGIEDCETERQRYYWNKIKAPYLYGEGILYDDEDHRSAKAAAAILKHQFKTDSPLKLKCSVEGGIIERGEKDQRVLKRTKIRGLALTFTPANNATLVEGLDLAKSAVTVEELELIKSYIPHAIQDVPSFIDFSQKVSIAKIRHNVEQIYEMVEGLKKNISLANRLDKTRPFPSAGSSYYSIGDNLPQFTGKDAQHAQKDVIKQIINNEHLNGKAYKSMLNPNTGKQELHIMVHRGISVRPDEESGLNKLLIRDNHIEQPTNAVHTLSPRVAHDYSNKEKGGGVFSFWVPISQVNSMGRYFSAGAKNRLAVPNKMFEGQTVTHYNEKTNEFYEKPVDPDDERESYAKNIQAASEQHISIKPGKYQRATEQDLKDLEESRQNAVKNIDKKDPKMDWFFKNYNRSILDPYGKGHSFILNKKLNKNLNKNITEPLEKASKKQLLQQLGSDPQAAEIADWLSKDVKRDDVQQWFLRGYKKDPKIWNPQNKEAVQHYVGTAGTNPDHDIGKIRFDKSHSFEDGMKLWKDAEEGLKNKKKGATNLLKPDSSTKKLIDLGNGWGWYDLGKGYDEAEGKAMAHCGNVHAQGAEEDPDHEHHNDRMLSLRKEHNINGEVYHEPRLSFIENNGYLGETKGFGNSKPAAKYHDAIIELLKHPRIKENVGGGYAPNSNFYLNDLPKDKLDKLLKDKPNLENLWKLGSGKVDPDSYPQKHFQEAEAHNQALQDFENSEPNIDQVRFRDIDPEYAKSMIKDHILGSDDSDEDESPSDLSSIMQSPHLDKSHVDMARDHNKQAFKTLLSSHAADKDHVSDALNDADSEVRHAAVKSPHFGLQHFDKAFNDENEYVRAEAVRSKHFRPEFVDRAMNDESDLVRSAAVRSPHFGPPHIDKALNDENAYVRLSAVASKNFGPQHMDKALNDPNPDVRSYAIQSRHFGPQHMDQALSDPDSDVRSVVARSPHFSQQHFDKLFNDASSNVRSAAVRSRHFGPQHMDQALNDSDEYVRHAAVRSPHFGPPHIDKALNDENGGVRHAVIASPHLNAQHGKQILNDKDAGVRLAFIESPHFGPQHMDQALSDSNEYVRGAAMQSPHYQTYLKQKGLNKALTAGYGGAGSPSNLTGGGVLQAELLDQGRSFRYIDCPNCGKDQVYMKHQVKCRSCGKSFPFDTLAKFFLSK